jgi:Metallo-peptidase family M12/Bacterial pre-peptidase C-terminal domain/Domain of unknown function (DUF4214)
MKLITYLLTVALLLSCWSLPALAGRTNTNFTTSTGLRAPDVVGPITGRVIEAPSQDPELTRHFDKYDLIKIDPDAAVREIKNRGKLRLKTSHGDFDLEFKPHDLRASDYYAQAIGGDGVARKLEKAPISTFRASVKGNARAQARMYVGANGLEGAIITGTEKYFIQPAHTLSKSARSDEFLFYKPEEVTETDDSCGVTLAEEVAAGEELAAAQSDTDITAQLNNPVMPLSPMRIARIATDADAEYVNGFGGISAAQNEINKILNVVDGIYQVETGITLQIGFQNFWTDQNTDPYTTADAPALLGQFRTHWNSNFPQHTRSLAHLWTGRDLDGGTIGIASLGVVCRNEIAAYGLSQRFPLVGSSNARTMIVTAHEIGHNFSAPHTTEANKSAPPEFTISCDNSIMEASLGSRTGSSFCSLSRSQIIGHANAYSSCLLNSSNPPPTPSCSETPITHGTINGAISNSDCASPSRGVPHFADRYTFDATMGQQISITLNQTSGNLDPYLYLIGPDGFVVDQAEFGSAGFNARIPETANAGVLTLPQTGRYTIEATSSSPGQTGGYELIFSVSTCTLSASVSAQHFSAGGGSATLNVGVSGSCLGYSIVSDPATGGANWILLSEGGGSGPRSFSFNISANGGTAGRRSFILIAPSGANSDIAGLRIPITQSGTGPDCSVTPISAGQTINGELTTSDCESPVRVANGLRTDRYTFNAAAGQQVAITLNTTLSAPLSDPFLTLIGPNGVVLLTDDDSGGGTDSRIPGGTGMLTLGVPGTYTIEVSSFNPNQTGTYAVTLSGTGSADWQPTSLNANQVEIKSWTISGRTSVYVKLTFPDAGYRVANWGSPVQSGSDFSVDAVVEKWNGVSAQVITTTAQIYDLGNIAAGNYTFTFKNSGTTVKVQPFTVSFVPPPSNDIDDPGFFVRQQYRDFLRREPDGPGLAHWTNEITMCTNPANRLPGESEANCFSRKRANTSAAFFMSPEFQNTGYFVLRVYRGSLGRMPHFGGDTTPQSEFTRDAATVSNGIVVNDQLSPGVINGNKQAFVNEFVTRSEFRALYDGLSNEQYVDKLFQTTAIAPTVDERNALIGEAGTSGGRASVLFKIVDGTTTINNEGHLRFDTRYGKAFYDNLFNAAFVQMEYFGYLLRDPDQAGFDHWLGKMNQFGNWVDAQMVLSFILSPEYRARFGSP